MLASLLLVLALSGDGGYDVEPTPMYFDRVIVQDFVDAEQTFIQRQVVLTHRVIHLFTWYDDVGYVYAGWIWAKPGRVFIDNKYPFFQRFNLKWWVIHAKCVEYEVSNRRIEEFRPREQRTIHIEEKP